MDFYIYGLLFIMFYILWQAVDNQVDEKNSGRILQKEK